MKHENDKKFLLFAISEMQLAIQSDLLNSNYFYLKQDRKLLDKYYRLLHNKNRVLSTLFSQTE